MPYLGILRPYVEIHLNNNNKSHEKATNHTNNNKPHEATTHHTNHHQTRRTTTKPDEPPPSVFFVFVRSTFHRDVVRCGQARGNSRSVRGTLVAYFLRMDPRRVRINQAFTMDPRRARIHAAGGAPPPQTPPANQAFTMDPRRVRIHAAAPPQTTHHRN